MNMISTGAFLNEMDASNKQKTLAEQFAAVWEKKNAKAARAGGVSLMALSLAACGGGSSTTNNNTDTGTDTGGSTDTPSTTVKLANDGGTYSLTTTVDGVSAPTSSSAKIYLNDNEPGDAYSFTLDASAAGSGALVIEFADAGDTATLSADSSFGNFTTLEVKNGTVDATAMTLPTGMNSVILNSGLKITASQGTQITSVTGTGELTVEVSTQAEIDQLISHMNTHGITASVKVAAASGSTLTADDISAGNTNVAAEAAGNVETTPVTYDAVSLKAGTDTATSDDFSGALVGAGANGSTVSAGDNLTGTDGSADKLTITATGDEGAGGYTLAGVQTSGIETIQISNFYTDGTVGLTVDMALMSGVKTVNVIASSATGDTTLTNAANIIDAGMASGAGDLTVGYQASVVSGTADAQNLTVSNTTAGTFTANKIETINITTSAAKSTLADVVSDTLKTVTVSGDKDLTVTASIDFKATADGKDIDGTIDASALTGKLDVTATTAQTVSIKGGSNDDTITLGGTLTKNDVIDGGDGTDTVEIAETANRTFEGVQLSNIEAVDIAVTTNTLTDVDVKALDDSIEIVARAGTTDKDVTINNLGAGQTVKVVNDSAGTKELGDVAVNLETDTGTADAMTVKLNGKTDANQTLDKLTFDDGAEEVTIDTSGVTGTGKALTLTSLVADGAKTINFTGAGNLIVSSLDESSTNVTTTIDASAATGTFAITEGVTNDLTIKGSAGQNTIAMGATLNNKDTITGGASAKDSVSATVGTATTATTGKFNISDVETLALTLTDGQTATVDLSASTGITDVTLAASGTNGNAQLNLNGLASGSKISTTDQATNDFDGTLAIKLADATGTADSINISLQNDGSKDNFTLTSSGVETLNIDSAKAVDDHGIDVSGVDATTINVTGGEAGKVLDLNQGTNKLNKALTEIDASTFKGDLVADASGTDSVGVTFKMGDLAITDTNGDAVTGSASTTSKDTLTGTFAATDTTAEFTQLSGIETYNLTFKDGVAITAANNDGIGDGDNKVETVTMSGGNTLTTYTGTAGSIDGTSLTMFDASALGGEVTLAVAGSRMDNMTIKGSTASAKDAVTYTGVNGLTATTGKAVTEGVETITVRTATAASTIDTSSMTGVTKIAVENDQNVTLTNLASGVEVQLGESATVGLEDYTGTLTVKMADTSGTDDSITFSTVASGTNDDVDATLVMAGVETTNIKISADTAAADVHLSLAGVDSSSIVVTGGVASEDLDLTKGGTALLNAKTTSVDASAFKGTLVASAQTNTATSFTANGGAAATLTGSTGSDTITIGKTTATHVLDGGAGADTANITLTTGTTDMTNYEGIEVYNLVADADAGAIVVTAAASKFFNDTMVQTVTLTGGKSTTTFDSGADGLDASSTLTLFDASGFAGKINDLALDADQLASTLTIKGGASDADLVTTTFDNDQTIRMEGIEKLAATFTADKSIDVGTYVSGLKTVTVKSDGAGAAIGTLTNLDAGVTVELVTDEANDGLTIVRATTSGTESQDIKLLANDAGEDVLFDMANVETLNIAMGTGSDDTDLSLANFDMDTAGQTNAVVVTGAVNLDIIALSADTTSIDSSAMTAGGVDIDGRTVKTTAITFTGSDAAAESIIMLNASDALNAGEKTGVADSLDINFGAVLGGISVDLTAADQVVTMDGVGNSAVQTGFENVDLAGYTGFGAVVTGNSEANVIVGTASADNITGGDGGDTITGGQGNDVISLTEATSAADTIKINTKATNGSDTVSGFTTADIIDFLTNEATDGSSAQTKYDEGAKAAAPASDSGLIVLSDNIGGTAESDLETLTGGAGGVDLFQAGSANAAVYLVVDDGTNGYVFLVESGGANQKFTAAEDTATLLVTLEGLSDVTTLSAANFADFTA